MHLVSVIIPVYKQKPDQDEELSFFRCMRVLYDYPIVIVCPQSLNTNYYESCAKKAGCNVLVQRFDDCFFKTIESYNQLLISVDFYKRFTASKFILIYQLDAYVFKDELKQWCEQKYDFIGAPLFIKWTDPDKTYKFMDGANGGLSLRDVTSALRILKRSRILARCKRIYYFLFLQRVVSFVKVLKLFAPIFHIRDAAFVNLIDEYINNEDYLWSHIFAKGFKDFLVAKSDTALKFSFEVNPSFLYDKNDHQLPFGCHAWQKYDPQFWKPFIKQET